MPKSFARAQSASSSIRRRAATRRGISAVILTSRRQQCAFKATAAPGDARRLAAEAVRDGFESIVAAGGDGTVNEVLNGIGDAPDGFARARLGVLPLGTVNVFARELKIPLRLERAWEVLQRGREIEN